MTETSMNEAPTAPLDAAEMVRALRRYAEALSLLPPMPREERLSLIWTVSVPPSFIGASLSASASLPKALAHSFDEVGVRAALSRVRELEMIAAELRSISERLEDQILRDRSKAATEALILYGSMRALAEARRFAEQEQAERVADKPSKRKRKSAGSNETEQSPALEG